MIDNLFKCADLIGRVLQHSSETRKRRYDELLRPLFDTMSAVHDDYAESLGVLLSEIPPAWDQGSESYDEALRKSASALLVVREKLAGPREKLRYSLGGYAAAKLPKEETTLLDAMVAYFPSGEASEDVLVSVLKRSPATGTTNYSLIVRQFYEVLKGGATVDIAKVIGSILERERDGWKLVCEAHARLEIALHGGR